MRAFHPGWLSAAVLFFSLMVILGSVPGEAHALSARFGDKLLHLLAYGLLAALCFRAISAKKIFRIAGTVILIAAFGLLDEFVQSFLPYRNASLADWCFDIGAALLVVSLLLLVGRTNPSTESHAKN